MQYKYEFVSNVMQLRTQNLVSLGKNNIWWFSFRLCKLYFGVKPMSVCVFYCNLGPKIKYGYKVPNFEKIYL